LKKIFTASKATGFFVAFAATATCRTWSLQALVLAEEVCCKNKFLVLLVLFFPRSGYHIVERVLGGVFCPFDQVELEVCPGEAGT